MSRPFAVRGSGLCHLLHKSRDGRSRSGEQGRAPQTGVRPPRKTAGGWMGPGFCGFEGRFLRGSAGASVGRRAGQPCCEGAAQTQKAPAGLRGLPGLQRELRLPFIPV